MAGPAGPIRTETSMRSSTCKGGLNDWKYCNPEVDKLARRGAHDHPTRRSASSATTAAQTILHEDLPIIHLYHESWIWGMKKKMTGFQPHPDGMIRLENVKFAS